MDSTDNVKLLDLEFQLCLIDGNYRELKKRYKKQFSKLQITVRLKIIAKYYFPKIYNQLKAMNIKRL